jgi:hypothetical protein
MERVTGMCKLGTRIVIRKDNIFDTRTIVFFPEEEEYKLKLSFGLSHIIRMKIKRDAYYNGAFRVKQAIRAYILKSTPAFRDY